MLVDKNHFKTMSDYGAGPGPAVHALHFTECASRLPAVLILPMTTCSGGSRPSPVNRHGFEIAGSGGSAIGPGNGPGAGRTAVGRMAARAATAKFSKIVLASAGEFPYSTSSHGGVAQLGERLTGSQEVRGSIPLVSTRALNEAPTQVGAFFHIGTQGQRRHHDPPGRQDRKKLRRARPL